MNVNEKFARAVIDAQVHGQEKLKEILWTHSRAVADMALECAGRRGLAVDADFVEQAALLHDIGIVDVYAPDIECYGELPYICHGIAGGDRLRECGLPRHALVCERHTGAGLTEEDIRRQGLPLPLRDMLPLTVEERLICYADKFYSKSGDLRRRKPLERVREQMLAHGADTLARFDAMQREFGL